jgi:hypothetical protein
MDFEISKIVSYYAQLGSELKEGAPVPYREPLPRTQFAHISFASSLWLISGGRG